MLDLCAQGKRKLDEYVEQGAAREVALLAGLSARDRRQLKGLLKRLLESLTSDIGSE